jgi:hypothetical protein
MGTLIKREVDDYYQQLSLFKKIFISRERIHREVDDLMNKTLPKRVEEYLRGEAFEQDALVFLDSSVDKILARPINELLGQIDPEEFQRLKVQIADRILELAQGTELSNSVSTYVSDAITRLQPQTLRGLLEHLNPNSAARGFRQKNAGSPR